MVEREIEALGREAVRAIEEAETPEALEEARRRFLGRNGAVAQMLKRLPGLSADQRPAAGQRLNALRQRLEDLLAARAGVVAQETLRRRLAAEAVDVTLPGRLRPPGRLHVLTQTVQEIQRIFMGMGFEVVEGTEVEDDEYNFERLNVPRDHPARDMQDTFYLDDRWLLRTHTTVVDARIMAGRVEEAKLLRRQMDGAEAERLIRSRRLEPPWRVITFGHCYRRDAPDATHSPMFHQVDGFMVGERVTFADLKGVLMAFARQFFGTEAARFRPSFFPFTEPSAEMEILFSPIGPDGKPQEPRWLEILGCGMFHPNVLRAAGLDPQRYTALAFGMGVERPAMIRYGIDDIRLFFENDLRFLLQF